jgi:integrase/recombinase XerD
MKPTKKVQDYQSKSENKNKREAHQIEAYLQKHYTKETTKSYKREIEIYLDNNPSAKKYVYAQIVNHIGSIRKRYKNANTISTVVAAIKVYYDYLCNAGIRKDNPTKSIRLRDQQNPDIQLQDLFTTVELEILMNRKDFHFNLVCRNKVLMSLLIYQGLRPKEMEALQQKDINLLDGSIYISATPRTNSRTLQLKPNQILLFQEYLTSTRSNLLKANESTFFLMSERGNAMLGEDITKHVKRIGKTKPFGKNDSRKVNAMTIRQSVITNLLKQNNDLRLVQTFAGHKYPSTTERYRQSNVEALQHAINQYHPMK